MTIKKYRADKNMKIENVISDQMPYSNHPQKKVTGQSSLNCHQALKGQ